jgi:hypothetical protein
MMTNLNFSYQSKNLVSRILKICMESIIRSHLRVGKLSTSLTFQKEELRLRTRKPSGVGFIVSLYNPIDHNGTILTDQHLVLSLPDIVYSLLDCMQ